MDDFGFYGLGNFVRCYDFRNKERNTTSHVLYMLNRVMRMFKYTNLPDTIPHRMLELYTMTNGHSVIIRKDDNLYVCFGGFSGEPNEYYLPTQYVIANPYLNIFNTYTIGDDCVLVRNDSFMVGLMPMFNRYATALVENELTMNMYDINCRIPALINAQDDKTMKSAQKFLSDIENGETGIIAAGTFFDGVRTQPYNDGTHQRITDLIEYQQYLKASWYNEIGLNANYNMKRESITANESQLNDDMLLPLIDDMLECRKNACDDINSMFGTDISVSFSSAWEDNMQEIEYEHDIMENEGGDDGNIDNIKNDVP